MVIPLSLVKHTGGQALCEGQWRLPRLTHFAVQIGVSDETVKCLVVNQRGCSVVCFDCDQVLKNR